MTRKLSGQQLGYDVEGRLSLGQNQPTSPTQTVNYLYDGSGNRVAMQSTVSGTTTLTSYIGSIEEVQSSGRVFLWDSQGTPTVAVLARVPNGGQMRPFILQFNLETGELVTAFESNPGQYGAMLSALDG